MFTITPKIIYWSFGCLIIFGVLVYLGFQINAFARAPILFIDLPDDLTVEQNTIMITGQTTRDARLFINNQEVIVSDNGYFQEEIYLQTGINILNFKSINRKNKTTYAQRKIFKSQNSNQ